MIRGKAILNDLCRNMDAAREMQIPICQDTEHGSSVCGSRTRRSFHWRRF
ncbi:MAG: fumarate hydratase [Eubacteriales bacterium]